MIDFDTITQRQLEEYFKHYHELGGDAEGNNGVQNAGASVRAANKLGWVELNADDAKPKDVMKAHVEILKGINQSLRYDVKN